MADHRPDPDQLLADVQDAERRSQRGRLKIFLGYAAGVGKTYSMLEHARRELKAQRDVVIGYVEPHARPDTERLTTGFEILPPRLLSHRGVSIREFDVDAALARRPELLLVDELAHSNAEGCRHLKRWQDIDELLSAGIDVWTTLNVQHIESLNDIVAQVTGVVVRETIPDKIFESADEIELIDVVPDELLRRLEQGKIYAREQVPRALQGFFQKANLNALRELSLRRAAHRIHTDVEDSRRTQHASAPWNTAERLMVCVGPSPTTAQVIRAAKRMADALDAPWLAATVETAKASARDSSVKAVLDHLRLAESMGAETMTLIGEDVMQTLIEFARTRNVTKLVIGKTTESRWMRFLWGSLVDRILQNSAGIDVFVIQGIQESVTKRSSPTLRRELRATDLVNSLLILIGCTLLAMLLRRLHLADSEANTVMIFLAGVSVIAYRYGRFSSIIACMLAVLIFNFCFVKPYWTFAVSDAQYLVTFAVMLTIGLAVSSLTARLRQQIHVTQQREQRTAMLYALGKQLSSLYGSVFLCNAAATKLQQILQADVMVFLRNEAGRAEPMSNFKLDAVKLDAIKHDVVKRDVVERDVVERDAVEQDRIQATAQWVLDHGQWAGRGTDTLPASPALFLPLVGSQACLGALAIFGDQDPALLLAPSNRYLLEACANQLALALERDQLMIDAANARVEAEAEQLRSSLLSSVSHDLRTPLATISGASSVLMSSSALSPEVQRELLQSISNEAHRLGQLLENILQMTRLEAGKLNLNDQWHVIEELVGTALERTRGQLSQHRLHLNLPADLPLIRVDGLLIEQLLVNLLENAARHTPPGTEVTVEAKTGASNVTITVSDNGPGIPRGVEDKIFEKFFRATSTADGIRGSGLGLAICRAIALSHNGQIDYRHRPGGGSQFVLQLPIAP